MAYTAYVLDQQSREQLKQRFPPKYDQFIGHHITEEFGVDPTTEPPEPASTRVVGYVDSGDGLEALVVSVNNSIRRPDGRIYHITWSLDPEKYAPKDSNELLSNKWYSIVLPREIQTTPETLK